MGRVRNPAASKGGRFTPPDTARVSTERLVLYELLMLLEQAPPRSELVERLRALKSRMPIIAREVDVAQDCAEMDGDEVEPTQPSGRR